MATRRSRDLKIAFVLDEQALRRLDGIFHETSREVEYTLGCSDGTSIDYSSLDEVLRFPNSPERRITSLSASTLWGDLPQTNIQFKEAGRFYGPVEYEVRGLERDVFHISGRLEEFVSTIRQWYSRVASLDFITVLMIMAISVFVFGFLIAAFLLWQGGPIQETSERQKVLGYLYGFGTWIAVFALGAPLNLIRRWLFPIGTFLIGHGADRHKAIVLSRRLIGGSFGVSLLASVIAAYLTR